MICQNARNNIAPMVLHGIDQSRICLAARKAYCWAEGNDGLSNLRFGNSNRTLTSKLATHIWNGVKEI